MWDREIFGTTVYYLIQWFFIYSILGWLVESIYMSFCNKKLTNRGFIHGPICPIYGVGALTVYIALRPWEGNYIALYFFGLILATTIEYFTAIVMQKIFGCIWWDYNDKPFNYKGILCLESSIAWGFYTVFLFMFLHRGVERITGFYTIEIGRILGLALIFYYMADFAISLVGAIDLNVKLKKLTGILEEVQQYLYSKNIMGSKKIIRYKLENSSDTSTLPDDKLKALAEKYNKVRFRDFLLSRHFIRSYQAFKIWGSKVEHTEEREKAKQPLPGVLEQKIAAEKNIKKKIV